MLRKLKISLIIVLISMVTSIDCYAEHGVLTFSNGKYVGNIENGKFNGFGTFTWSNGASYSGSWKNGKRDGEGIKTSPTGNKAYFIFSDGNTVEKDYLPSKQDKIEDILNIKKLYSDMIRNTIGTSAPAYLISEIGKKTVWCINSYSRQSHIQKCMKYYRKKLEAIVSGYENRVDELGDRRENRIRNMNEKLGLDLFSRGLEILTGHSNSNSIISSFPIVYQNYDFSRGYITNGRGGFDGLGANTGSGFDSDGNGGFTGTGSNIGGGYRPNLLSGYDGTGKFLGSGWVSDGIGGYRGTGINNNQILR
jgi:hypothetical protein